jgi:hypothetical protein
VLADCINQEGSIRPIILEAQYWLQIEFDQHPERSELVLTLRERDYSITAGFKDTEEVKKSIAELQCMILFLVMMTVKIIGLLSLV